MAVALEVAGPACRVGCRDGQCILPKAEGMAASGCDRCTTLPIFAHRRPSLHVTASASNHCHCRPIRSIHLHRHLQYSTAILYRHTLPPSSPYSTAVKRGQVQPRCSHAASNTGTSTAELQSRRFGPTVEWGQVQPRCSLATSNTGASTAELQSRRIEPTTEREKVQRRAAVTPL